MPYALIQSGAIAAAFSAIPPPFAAMSEEERAAAGFVAVVDARTPPLTEWHVKLGEHMELAGQEVRLLADYSIVDATFIRETLRDRINALRNLKLAEGVWCGDHRFDSDAQSIANLTSVIAAATAGITLPAGFAWRSGDNIDVPIDLPGLIALGGMALARSQEIYQASWAVKAALEATERPEWFDVTAGW